MLRTRSLTSSLGLGLLLSVVGLSYALATPGNMRRAITAGMRGSGSNPRLPLDFKNPFLSESTDRDLGDAAIGSQIVRHVRARGGFPPHRFTSDHQNSDFAGTTSLGDAIAALPSEAKPGESNAILNLTGRLKGAIGGVGGTIADGTPLRFDVTVTDSKGVTPNQKTETFRLTLVNSDTFKFAQSSLNNGVEFKPYLDRIQVVGGKTPVSFSASNVTVTEDGITTPKDSLEDIGLFLNPKSGVLTGRPLFSGTVSFSASCSDKNGAIALSRDKSSVGQAFSFVVDPGKRITSQLFATGISIKGDLSGGDADTIKYMGLVNVEELTLAQMTGAELTLEIGNYTSPTVILDENGKGSTGNSAGTFMSASITADGAIKITISRASFGGDESIVRERDLLNNIKVLPVSLTIGDFFDSSELLKFGVRASSAKFGLQYKFGPGNLGGAFIITSVVGKDDANGTGDSWKVSFLTLPAKEEKVDRAASVTAGVGTNFTDSIAVDSVKGKVFSTERRDTTGPHIVKFAFDAKGKGGMTTGVLPQLSPVNDTNTDIPPSLAANGKRAKFAFIFALYDENGKELFGGEGSRAILPKGSTWISKNLGK